MSFKVIPLDEALNLFEKEFEKVSFEFVNLENANKRVIAEDFYAPFDFPPFSKSTVDGYAVKASDTFGASESNPLYFKIKGKIK